MLKEVIVVEGKSDIQRIHQAIDADCCCYGRIYPAQGRY